MVKILASQKWKKHGDFSCQMRTSSPKRVKCVDKRSRFGDDIEYIGRGAPENGIIVLPRPSASLYANHYKVQPWGPYTLQESLEKYKDYALNNIGKDKIQRDLKGKNLLCWCSQSPRDPIRNVTEKTGNHRCHGDILAEIANW